MHYFANKHLFMCDLLKAAAFLDKETICKIMLEDSPPGNSDNCMMGILNIYYIVYANHLLARGTGFSKPEHQKVCDIIKERSKEILDFFESTYPISKSQRDIGFLQWASWMAQPEDTTIENEFESSEETLLDAGFRKIDLDLWLACRKLDLFSATILLTTGANPNVHIPFCLHKEDLPLKKDYRHEYETDCVLWHVGGYSADFFDCYNGYEYWDCGVNGRDLELGESYLPCLVQSAAYQIFYNIIQRYSENFAD